MLSEIQHAMIAAAFSLLIRFSTACGKFSVQAKNEAAMLSQDKKFSKFAGNALGMYKEVYDKFVGLK
jgi:hypothetical protein